MNGLVVTSNTMYMLVRIGQYVITNQLSGAPVSYLSQQLGNCLISVKRQFDKFIVSISLKEKEVKFKYSNHWFVKTLIFSQTSINSNL